MANCINCAAPLSKDSLTCPYCGTRNEVDLKGMSTVVEHPESDRICPRCNIPLQTIDLKIEGKFLIEKCDKCMGMFFDPGELEALMDKSVSNVYHIDHKQLQNLQQVKRHQEYGVTYIKCPVCSKLMHRKNFGSMSGVIIDTCKNDGIWLDGGELRQLMEWMKAGGQMLHQKKETEMKDLQQKSQQRKTMEIPLPGPVGGPHGYGDSSYVDGSYEMDLDLGRTIGKVVSRIFRLI